MLPRDGSFCTRNEYSGNYGQKYKFSAIPDLRYLLYVILNINIPVIQHSILACVWYKQVAIKRFMISINCRISGMLHEFIP